MGSLGEELLESVRRFFDGRSGVLFVECPVVESRFCRALAWREIFGRSARPCSFTRRVVSDRNGPVSEEQCFLHRSLQASKKKIDVTAQGRCNRTATYLHGKSVSHSSAC
jgi:hypothetical protein